MRLTVVNSGSSGNCYILDIDERKILLDLGVRWKEIQRAVDFDYSLIDAALITHRHADHALSVKNAIRNGIECFGLADGCTQLAEKKWSRIGDWKVCPIPVKHTDNDGDECPNQAFIVQKSGQSLLYMTDWEYCHYRLTNFNINHFLIAINYSEIPEGENRDHVLRGHSSLDTAKQFLLVNLTEHTKSVIACHLSETNADAEQIYQELVDIAPDGCLVDIAEKGKVFNIE